MSVYETPPEALFSSENFQSIGADIILVLTIMKTSSQLTLNNSKSISSSQLGKRRRSFHLN